MISQYGQFDVAGFPKAAAYWYRSWWLANTPGTSDDRPPVGGAKQAHIVELWDNANTNQTHECPFALKRNSIV